MKIILFLIAGLTIFCTFSCRKTSTCDVFPDATTVTDFQDVALLHPDTTILGEDYYINSFTLYDTLLFIETNNEQGSWSVFSLNTLQAEKILFPKGHAANEFLSPSSCWTAQFVTQNDSLYTILYDFSAGKAYKANLSRKTAHDINHLEHLKQQTPRHLDRYIYLSDSSYIIRRMTLKKQPKELIFYNGDRQIVKECFHFINQICVPDKDHNALAATIEYSCFHDKLIIAHHYSNTINILSLSADHGKSISLGEKPFSQDNILNLRKRRKDFFLSICCQKDYFAILCFCWKRNRHSILTFDYNGNPLKEYDFEEKIKDFEIDDYNKHIYALDSEKGVLVRYSF